MPFFAIVLRKACGLGGRALAGGGFTAPFFAVSRPAGEFGGVGPGRGEAGFRRELGEIDHPEEREALYEGIVKKAYEAGKAVNTASHFEFDDVIGPTESRRRIIGALGSVPAPAPRMGEKRAHVDTW